MSAPLSTPASHLRTNTVIAAWACLVVGAGVILGVPGDPFALALGAPLAVSGVILLFIGLGMNTQSTNSPEEIAAWSPDAVKMPDAGRPMYRVDTSLDPPIRSSILCGRCGHLEWVDGSKPSFYDCVDCGTPLWIKEEE
ncbi:MAG TPA: hypothetical protein QGF70_05560 [Candidatus Thalassarchaeaceae archaeon]|nr:hypothetical protein [Candidatus Thalassarchaeaceae archaeon]HJL65037.1 hypothetical protein [Candidatus Thalassarchaeaceae archaeon]HJO42378.1 hypothetical protein [Candidatus Thalassarchaeaceae archaeon]